tara:strand:+ start:118 stop:1098 length:981 start_codon:yes stop_codon:yes gene_type:complete
MPISGAAATINLRPDLAEAYEFDLESEKAGFVASRVLTVVDVGLAADNPGKIPLEQLLFNGDTKRASGSGYNRGSWKFERFTYSTEENGWEEPLDDRDVKRYQGLLQAEQIATARAFSVVQRNAEQRVANAVFNTSTWTGSSLTTAITNEWDDTVNAVPITDVEAAVAKVYDGSALWANALVINRKVFRNLRNCAQIIDRIAASGAGDKVKASDINEKMLAAVFDLDYVIVAGNSKNTANEGATPVVSQIWSNEYAMVCRVATSSDMREPSIGRTFHWSQDGSSIGGTVETYREEQSRSDIYRVRHDTDEVIMYAQAGHLLSNITT